MTKRKFSIGCGQCPRCTLSLAASESQSSLPQCKTIQRNWGQRGASHWRTRRRHATVADLHFQAHEAKAPDRDGHRRLVSRDAARSFTALRRSRFRASSLLEDHSWQMGSVAPGVHSVLPVTRPECMLCKPDYNLDGVVGAARVRCINRTCRCGPALHLNSNKRPRSIRPAGRFATRRPKIKHWLCEA